MRLCLGCILPLCIAAGALPAAQDDDLMALSLEELGRIEVSIATGTPRVISRAPAMTSVIIAHDLHATASQDIDELLQSVPGVHVSHGGFVYGSRYFIRGIVSTYNPQTLVLVNGIPMTSLFTGDRGERMAGAFGLPVEMIERIEVVRGPGSAVYGADAFAGVINVITRHPAAVQGGELHVGGGSFNSAHATLLQAVHGDGVHGLLSLNVDRTDGDQRTIAADVQSTLDGFGLAPAASLAPGPVNLDNRDLDARMDIAWGDYRLRSSFRYDSVSTAQGINESLDPDGRFNHHHGTADFTWTPADFAAQWDLEAQLSYLYSDFRNPGIARLYPRGTCIPDLTNLPACESFPDGVLEHPELAEENARAGVNLLFRGWQGHQLRFGTGFYWGDVFEVIQANNYLFSPGGLTLRPGGLTDISDTPATFVPEQQRTSSHLFVQDEWAFAPGWDLTLGARHDHYSDFGGTTNPRLALVWSTTAQLTTKLLYGEAFRAPAFFELYPTTTPVARGNPALQPEKLRSLELGLAWRPGGDVTFDVNIYALRIRDYIDFLAGPGGIYTAQNAGRIDGHGLETELRYQLMPTLQLLANYSYQHTEDRQTGHTLGLAPRDKFYLRGVWDLRDGWLLTPQLTVVGKRKRQFMDTRPSLDGYATFDLALRKRWSDQVETALVGRNLFDADVREAGRGAGPGQVAPPLPHDLPQAGASVLLECSARW